MPRLNKYIASTGLTSRRKADELISEGKLPLTARLLPNLVFTSEKKTR